MQVFDGRKDLGETEAAEAILDEIGHLPVGLDRVRFAVKPEPAQHGRKLRSREFLSLLRQISQFFGNRAATCVLGGAAWQLGQITLE